MTVTQERKSGTTSSQTWLSGIIPPMCTPLTADREVDRESLERLIGFLIEGGVDGLFVLGTSSEAPYLPDHQRDTVVEVTVKTVAGQVPVLAGVLDMSTERMMEQAARATERGADGIVATAPFYVRGDHPIELAIHYRALKASIEVPLFAYDIPNCVHTKLQADFVLELAADGTLSGLKDSSGDIHGLRSVLMGRGDNPGFAVFTGSERVVDCVMLMGADGAVPGLANVDPHGFVELYESCRAGEWEKAARQQDRLVRLHAVSDQVDPSAKGITSWGLGGFKTALMLRGVISTNAMALPQIALVGHEIDDVRAILLAEGLL